MSDDHLLLKWGGLKSWAVNSPAAKEALKEYFDLGIPFAGIQTHLSDRQKELLCIVIDECQGTIQSDWTGDILTKDEAKQYVRDHQ